MKSGTRHVIILFTIITLLHILVSWFLLSLQKIIVIIMSIKQSNPVHFLSGYLCHGIVKRKIYPVTYKKYRWRFVQTSYNTITRISIV